MTASSQGRPIQSEFSPFASGVTTLQPCTPPDCAREAGSGTRISLEIFFADVPGKLDQLGEGGVDHQTNHQIHIVEKTQNLFSFCLVGWVFWLGGSFDGFPLAGDRARLFGDVAMGCSLQAL